MQGEGCRVFRGLLVAVPQRRVSELGRGQRLRKPGGRERGIKLCEETPSFRHPSGPVEPAGNGTSVRTNVSGRLCPGPFVPVISGVFGTGGSTQPFFKWKVFVLEMKRNSV